MSKSYLSSVAGASLLIIFVNIASKGIGFLREIIFAGSFGLSKDFDLYLLGTAIPFVLNVAIYYLAQNFFLPLFNREKVKPNFQEFIFFSRNVVLFLLSGTIIGVLLYVGSFFIESFAGFPYDTNSTLVASRVLQILALSLPIHAVISVISAYLQARYDFTLAIVSQVIPNIFIIVAVYVLGSTLGVFSIPIGYVVGSVIQLTFLIYKVKFALIFNKKSFQNLLSSSGQALGLVILIELSGQIFVIIDRMFIAEIETGGIAALSYASTVFSLPISVIALAFATAIFPKLSELAANSRWAELTKTFFQAVDISFFVFIPIAAVLFLFGDVIIEVLYQRGRFGPDATELTTAALQYYAPGLVFLAGCGIVHKLMLGAGHTKILSLVMVTTVIIKLIGNFALVPVLGYRGMALATSIGNASLFVIPFLFILYRHRMSILTPLLLQMLISVTNMSVSILITLSLLGFADRNQTTSLTAILLFLFIYILIGSLIRQSAIHNVIAVLKRLRGIDEK